MNRLCAPFCVVLSLAASGLAGCIRVVNQPLPAEDSIALSATSLQRDSGDLVVEDADLNSVARQADVTVSEVNGIGLKAGHYTPSQVEALIGRLRTDEEQYTLAAMSVRWSEVSSSSAIASDAPVGDDKGAMVRFMAWARSWFNKPNMTIDEVWKKREEAIRAVAAKDSTRQWLQERLTTHEFRSSLRLTFEVVSSDSVPILAGERAFIRLDGHHRLALSKRQTQCNDAGSACRYVYSHLTTEADRPWLQALAFARAQQQHEDAGKPSPTCPANGICVENLQLELQVAGKVMKRDLPLTFMNVVDSVLDAESKGTTPRLSGAN